MEGSSEFVHIRSAGPADEEFLWRMLYYASHSNDEPGVSPGGIKANPDLIGYITGWHSSGHIGVIAETPAVPVGAAWLRLLDETDRKNPVFVDPQTPELAIAVEPGHEGRGIGTSLIEELVARAATRFETVVLSVRSGNPAVRLYERLGFVIIADMVNRVGTHSVKMLKAL